MFVDVCRLFFGKKLKTLSSSNLVFNFVFFMSLNVDAGKTLYIGCVRKRDQTSSSGWVMAHRYFHSSQICRVVDVSVSCSFIIRFQHRIERDIVSFSTFFLLSSAFVLIVCRELNKRLVEEQAKKIFERSMRQEQDFGEYFTGKFGMKQYQRELFSPENLLFNRESRSFPSRSAACSLILVLAAVEATTNILMKLTLGSLDFVCDFLKSFSDFNRSAFKLKINMKFIYAL